MISCAFSEWFETGDEAFSKLIAALGRARESIRLETYIYAVGEPGSAIRDALIQAARRNVRVRVLIDALGSQKLPADFFAGLEAAGGIVRRFNPFSLRRLPVRNHRKLVVIDDSAAVVGGFNIAPEYLGDGVRRGWCDVGMDLTGAAAAALGDTFDEMWERADERHSALDRLRRRRRPPPACADSRVQVLPSSPGRGRSAFLTALHEDLARARSVRMAVAYFLPGRRLRGLLRSVVRRGGSVEIIVPGRTDVPLSQRAARFLYPRLFRSGVELWEYQPQVLHAKLYLVDDAVYVGSSNLDTRSLYINHELMVRLTEPAAVRAAQAWFDAVRNRSHRVEPQIFRAQQDWWTRLRQRWAHFLLARVDPYVTRWLAADPR
jgi:cardiolipin synthase A/B